MHDNALPHTAKKTLAFLRKEKVKVLELPPQSPDLNLIENLWGIMKKRL
jgi:transposase